MEHALVPGAREARLPQQRPSHTGPRTRRHDLDDQGPHDQPVAGVRGHPASLLGESTFRRWVGPRPTRAKQNHGEEHPPKRCTPADDPQSRGDTAIFDHGEEKPNENDQRRSGRRTPHRVILDEPVGRVPATALAIRHSAECDRPSSGCRSSDSSPWVHRSYDLDPALGDCQARARMLMRPGAMLHSITVMPWSSISWRTEFGSKKRTTPGTR